ncbi:MAG: fluoride efflux transporter CrcB [Flavobacteriales bacterium]|nr:fluoride efflux transporter CrcB [Flavobacteriales bacterium]
MWIIVGLGGFIGGAARHFWMTWGTRLSIGAFPWALMGLNVLGSLAIGAVFGLSQRYQWFTPEWRLLLGAGVCGGFTTFSAFSLETVQLLQRGETMQAALFALGSVALCVIGTGIGLYLTSTHPA